MIGSKALHEGFWREWLREFPVSIHVNRRDGGFEIVASATRRKYFYVAWLPARATKKEIEGAACALRDEVARLEGRK